ncbi:MAG: sigma-54-dependent Fis family transcriptional regulator [Nitrospirota bacterium]|nr:sigma-54-dependent Fis family transcriptional regulator [Nitrospirota bacterium]MDE3223972.1 sigma-54-dependent Fis family transcriptional regulator [Nitrospirota bacterium]MDE3242980.1 sigma-54-dependent Fis family transcriptional regulator [Nitrospirota bacterium]
MEGERILLVDDDEGLLHLLKIRLTAMGFAITACPDADAALAEARREVFDMAITDLRLAGRDGLALMEELRQLHPELPVLILTAHGSIPNAVEAMQKGACGYLTKPFDDKEFAVHVEKALAQRRMSREIQRLKLLVKELYGIENVVARSPSMQELLQQVARVADTDATISLSGETGTGKEVIARVVHCNSRRAKGPFVAINCGAIPENLIESELFGHAKGAFTGAQQAKRGLFQSAERGTLFLDEIGETPLAVQVKLLRALQEREVQEVGGAHPTKVDVRIITATNRDLAQAVKEGTFREDLFYRIQVVPIAVPPLRERRDDIPALAQHFLRQSAGRSNKDVRGFLPDAMHQLTRQPWPGNVRELENVVEKAVIMATQNMITADLLPAVPASSEGQLRPLTEARGEFEQRYLKEVMQAAGGNISRAAQIAGRYRADFYKLLRKHGLHPGDTKGAPTDGPPQAPEPEPTEP